MASRLSTKGKESVHLNSRKLILWILPAVLACLSLFIFIWSASSVHIYSTSSSLPYGVYTDKELGGRSSGTVAKEDERLTFKYDLAKGYAYPYAGLYFTVPPKTFESIQQPTCFHLDLKAANGLEIPLILNEKIQLHGLPNHRLWQYNLKLSPNQNSYKVPLSDFEVPAWWYKQYPQFNKESPLDLTKVDGMSVQNCTHLAPYVQDTIWIKSISYQKDFTSWYIGLAIGFAIWLVLGAIYIILQKKKQHVFIPFVATVTESAVTNDWQRIQTYLSIHYMQDLSMDTLQQDLGIAKHKIAALVKENTSLIFKQYLNQIRIAEATRLLTQTDLPIGEIADKVGYGHISNFNRVFKEHTQKAPSDLRKNTT